VTSPAAELGQQEAVLLAHPLVARVAERAGTRILFVKGPTAVAVGARPDRPSSDVDVLVDPAGFDDLCRALEASGWSRRHGDVGLVHSAQDALEHSVHYLRDGWPSDLDVHFAFPGFLAPAGQVFDTLHERREVVTVAGVGVPSADLLGQSLVVALHALRDPRRERSVEDLEHLQARLGGAGGEPGADRAAALSELAALATRTGSARTAAPFLERLGLAPDDRDLGAAGDEGYRAWSQRAAGPPSGVGLWAREIGRTPWRDKPGAIRHAVLPSRDVLLSSHLAPGASQLTIARLHVVRWSRGLRSLLGAGKAR
jgi:hypothetical protein